MAEYLIQDVTLQNIADAIRNKIGTTGPIAVSDMANQIEGITDGGGGTVKGAHTVTFMLEDGSTVLGTKLIMDGDSCGDVIALGFINTPTKESTAQYEYTFNGWSLTAGGDADSNALVNVTEDRTVYAAFKAETRYYTINFHDGETLLETHQIAYGTTPDYTIPNKDGYLFGGWNPTITSVSGDADYYAVWEEDVVKVAEGITGASNQVTWYLTDTGVLNIKGTGDLPCDDSGYISAPWYSHRASVKKVIIGEGITTLNANCFSGYSALEEVVLPQSLTQIGLKAFFNCNNCNSIVWNTNGTWYYTNGLFFGGTKCFWSNAPATVAIYLAKNGTYTKKAYYFEPN